MYRNFYLKCNPFHFRLLAFLFVFTFSFLNASAQKTITGTVTDELKLGIPGVSVTVKGQSTGAVTNEKGQFTLAALPTQTLIFSYLGYTTKEVLVGQASTLTVNLVQESNNLSEVVVVGYGTAKKGNLTGAIAGIGAKEIEKLPVQNALQAVQGRVSGVDITSNARPGEMGSIRIRGNRSLLATNDPLYVVDGIPLSAGGIESISPHDIESIDILKDASATAIYGSRAANGVILVTTKKGKNGLTNITYNATATVEKIHNESEMFNSGEYAEYRRNAYRVFVQGGNVAYTTPYPNPKDDFEYFGKSDLVAWENFSKGYTWVDKANRIAAMRPTTAEEKAKWGVAEVPIYDASQIATTDWTGYVEQTGITQDHTLSVSSGTDKVSSYFSAGYLDQKGTNIGQDYKRYSTKLSVDFKPTTWFSMGGSINASWSVQNYGYTGSGSRSANGIYAAALGMLPYAVPYDENGQYIYQPGGDVGILNPILEADYVTNERTVLRALGSFYAEIQPIKGLKYRVNFGPDFRNNRSGQFNDQRSILQGGGATTSTNYARLSQGQNFTYTLDNLIFYDKAIGEKHKFNVTLLQSSQLSTLESSNMTASKLPYNSQLWYNLASTSKGALDSWSSAYSKNTLSSLMARVNYTFNDKYLLTVSSRWDGSSVLAEGNKWSSFPSVALAWKMEEESFMKDIKWINQLKPRFGVGVIGNSSIDPYSTAGGLTQMPIVFGNQVVLGYIPSDPKASNPATLPNMGLKWERTTQYNLGVDYSIFNNRVSGSIEYYRSTTNDLLMNRTISSVSGYTSTYFNIGQTKNKGFEFSVSTRNIDKPDFRWNTDFNIGTNSDQVTETYNGKQDAIELKAYIGKSLFNFYDYQKIGIWQTADAAEMAKFNANGAGFKAGDIRVEDLNNDYKIDANNDRKVVGNKFPKYTGGITNTFNYKNWEFSFFFYARSGFMIEGGAVDMQGRYASRKVDYWTVDNPTNAYPRADYGNGGQPTFYSSMNYLDGTFVKLKNVSLGYAVPRIKLEKLHMSNLKIYTQVLNPYLYSKNGIIDPDISSSVSSRSLVLGINASF
ncbi:SusC/RagA family TonB-linked outer membrane protein [Pedobacter sp.]|uniref:SusC/RagA family TonB-linked outer membrane protein n=1 Tax=Pedobacter sp. TaxID=1411316 RepID=UPI003D7F9DFE